MGSFSFPDWFRIADGICPLAIFRCAKQGINLVGDRLIAKYEPLIVMLWVQEMMSWFFQAYEQKPDEAKCWFEDVLSRNINCFDNGESL